MGSPNKSSTARVSIQVAATPVSSEHGPVIKSLDQHVEVTESDAVGFLVALIQASDEDGDTLWYKIVGKLYVMCVFLVQNSKCNCKDCLI